MTDYVVTLNVFGHPLGGLWLGVLFSQQHRDAAGVMPRDQAEQVARSLQAEAVEKAVSRFPDARDFPRFIAEALPPLPY